MTHDWDRAVEQDAEFYDRLAERDIETAGECDRLRRAGVEAAAKDQNGKVLNPLLCREQARYYRAVAAKIRELALVGCGD